MESDGDEICCRQDGLCYQRTALTLGGTYRPWKDKPFVCRQWFSVITEARENHQMLFLKQVLE